jgi:hypothetical protein
MTVVGDPASRLLAMRGIRIEACDEDRAEGNMVRSSSIAPATQSTLQDIAGLTLARDLRDLRRAQRSGACSPRLPGVAEPSGRVERPVIWRARGQQGCAGAAKCRRHGGRQ